MSFPCGIQYPLCMTVGNSFERTFALKDSEGAIINLTGYTADVQIRTQLSSLLPTIELTSTEVTTTWGSSLTIDNAAGTITMYISPSETDMLLDIVGDINGFWDMRLQDNSDEVMTIYRSSQFVFKPASTRVPMR